MTEPIADIISKPPATGIFTGAVALVIGLTYLAFLELPSKGNWMNFLITTGTSFILFYLAHYLFFNRKKISISKTSLEIINLSKNRRSSFHFEELRSWKASIPKTPFFLPPAILTLYFNEKKLTFTSLQMNEIYPWIEWMEEYFPEKKMS